MSRKLEWLNEYSGQTTEQLLALEGEFEIASLVLAFEQAMDQKSARVGEDRLSEAERTILAVEALEREVNNGGYAQFFVNSSREYAPIIVRSLREIGCPVTAEITRNAIAIINKRPITDEEIKNGTWNEDEERFEALNKCDVIYFQACEPIEMRLFEFIKSARENINP